MPKLFARAVSSPRDGATRPWVLVAGGFHLRGGMDRANAALAEYLIERGTPLHLVAHEADAALAGRPGVVFHQVPRPLGSFFLGEWLLGWCGRGTARRVTGPWPKARVLVNGGNCYWPDINWVHCVHQAWRPHDSSAPLWFRLKNRIGKFQACRREWSAMQAARLVIANSEQTRRQILGSLDVDPHRVETVYLGADPNWGPASPRERVAAREWLGTAGPRPLVVFVGALGHDRTKGFDTLWSVWRTLCASPDWDADLIVAGGGHEVRRWGKRTAEAGLAERVRLLGFTERVYELLAAADLLVSPVRYEAYGLNVQEAICRGVPAMVSACAGIAERYPPELGEMLLPDPEDVSDLLARLVRWRSQKDLWKERFRPFGDTLRGYTWKDMARRIVSIVEEMDRETALN